MAAQDYEQLSYNGPAGCQIGDSATAKVAFFGVTPAAQRASAAQASFTISIGTSTTSWGFASSDQFNNFVLQLREIQATLTAMGIWKGAA